MSLLLYFSHLEELVGFLETHLPPQLLCELKLSQS